MHIGVDATCWQNNRGYGRHARALLSALVHLDMGNQYTFFMDSTEGLESIPGKVQVQVVRTSVPSTIAASSTGHRSFRDMARMSRAVSSGDFDLLLFPTIYTYIPVFSRAKKIVIIHDVIAEHYAHLTLPTYRARLFWKTKVALGRWQADVIVTISDYSKQEILKRFKISPERVFVVGEASDPAFRLLEHPMLTPRLEALGLTQNGRSIVYVGGFSPHKNLESLVSTFAKVVSQKAFSDVRLFMVGEFKKEVFHSYFGTIKKQVDDLKISDRVIFTGYLPDEELVVLLNLSTVLVLPSLMEGFGLPAVEAAACGCPVIATTASPLPNLLGKGGLYVNPAEPRELEFALIRVLESEGLRRHMRETGLAATRQLTWDAAAREMMTVIQKVVQ